MWQRFRDYLRLIDWWELSTSALVLVVGLWVASLSPHDGGRENYGRQTSYDEHPSTNDMLVLVSLRTFLEDHDGVITAIATVVIAAFTIVLAKSTGDLHKGAVKQAEMMRTIERAYVKMSHHSPPGLHFEQASGLCWFKINVKNYGDTPATVTDVLFKLIVLANGDGLPATPDYTRSRIDPPINAFLVKNDDFDYTPKSFDVGLTNVPDIINGNKLIYICGYVDYRDSFGDRRRGGWARRYNPAAGLTNNLVFVTQPGYNYDRVRVPGEGSDWDEDGK
jgi:hypothetical protein